MKPHSCILPGRMWADCLCDEIDPSDRPCLTCEARDGLIGECLRCRAAVDASRAEEKTKPKKTRKKR